MDRRTDRWTDGGMDILMTFLTNVRSDKHQVVQISGRKNIGSDKWRILYRSDKWRILCIGRTNSRLDKWRILCIGQTNDAFYIGRTNVKSDSRTNCGVHFWRSQKTRGIVQRAASTKFRHPERVRSGKAATTHRSVGHIVNDLFVISSVKIRKVGSDIF
jgi:hypothetical protein